MKTIKILFNAAFLSVTMLNAQQKDVPITPGSYEFNHVLRVGVFEALTGGIDVSYEHVLGKRSSFDVEALYVTSAIQERKYYREQNLSANYVSLNTGYRYYLTRKENRPQGWYLRGGLLTDYGKVKQTTGTKDKANYYALGAQLKTGYQLILPKFLKGFTADLGIGADYRRFFIKNLDGSDSNSVWPVIDLSIGYSF